MNSIPEQKSRYISAGNLALDENNYHDAWMHFGNAAECAIHLAEKTDGAISQAYLAEFWELIELTEGLIELSQRMPQKSTKSKRESSDTTSGATLSSKPEMNTSKAEQFILTEKPSVRFSDVAGLEEIKRVVQEDIIDAVEDAEVNRVLKISPGGGAFMYGPPGNGKTLIARAIAGELNAPFLCPLPSQIKSKYQGVAPKVMRVLFEEASKHECAVIFIDEMHDLLGKKDSAAVSEFLILSEGISRTKNSLLILGATNFPWNVNIAVAGRLKNRIYVGMPDENARKKIFELQFEGVPHTEDFPFDVFSNLSEIFSGRDIEEICKRAKQSAKQRWKTNGKTGSAQVSKEDVFGAITSKRPSVLQETIKKYQQWNCQTGAPES